MTCINNKRIGTTHEELAYFHRYKEAFGKVVKAEMITNTKACDYLLTLTNEIGETMALNEMSSGYQGEGSCGTQEVLQACGFNIPDNYAFVNTDFILNK